MVGRVRLLRSDRAGGRPGHAWPAGRSGQMTWVPGAADSGYGIAHLPYGVLAAGQQRRPAVRIGDYALDLAAAEEAGLLDAGGRFRGTDLNPFLAAGPAQWQAVRERVRELLTDPAARPAVEPLLRPAAGAVLPFQVADFVDFYSSEHHAANVGRIFRPDRPDLPANWRHLPAGYHGRAGTVVVSGTPVVRPCGQYLEQAGAPRFGPSTKLDLEAEVGFVVGVRSEERRVGKECRSRVSWSHEQQRRRG